MKSIRVLLVPIFFLIFLFASCTDNTLTRITLQLKWKHQFQFAGYYAAIEKGYYKDAGLSVTLREASGEQKPNESVYEGAAQFGIGTSDVVLERSEGHDIVVLAPVFEHSPQVILASVDEDIDSVAELVGKRLMLEPYSAAILAYLGNAGVAIKDISLVPHTFDVSSLINGEADAMSAYETDEPFLLEEADFNYTVFSPRSAGIDFYGDVLFTTERYMDEHPEIVDTFLKASIQGWEYAMDHPDEIITLILEKYSDRHSRKHLEYEAETMKKFVFPATIQEEMGNTEKWESIINTYKKFDFLKNEVHAEDLLYSTN